MKGERGAELWRVRATVPRVHASSAASHGPQCLRVLVSVRVNTPPVLPSLIPHCVDGTRVCPRSRLLTSALPIVSFFSPPHSLSSLPFGQIVPFVQGASGLDGRPGPPVSVISPSPFPCPSLSGLWIPLVFPAVALFAPHPTPAAIVLLLCPAIDTRKSPLCPHQKRPFRPLGHGVHSRTPDTRSVGQQKSLQRQ